MLVALHKLTSCMRRKPLAQGLEQQTRPVLIGRRPGWQRRRSTRDTRDSRNVTDGQGRQMPLHALVHGRVTSAAGHSGQGLGACSSSPPRRRKPNG